MTAYCAHSDVYDNGLPRGAVPNPARLAASALASTDEISLDVHGFDLDDVVTVRADASGSLPAPLAENTSYYVIPVTDSAFKLAATAGGSAINLTTDGERVMVIAPFPIDAAIAWASRIVDDMLPAHVVPLVAPYPAIVKMTCGELAAGKLAGRVGSASKALSDIVDAARKRLERWGAGVPIRGDNAPPAAGLAVSATAPLNDRVGWNKWGGL